LKIQLLRQRTPTLGGLAGLLAAAAVAAPALAGTVYGSGLDETGEVHLFKVGSNLGPGGFIVKDAVMTVGEGGAPLTFALSAMGGVNGQLRGSSPSTNSFDYGFDVRPDVFNGGGYADNTGAITVGLGGSDLTYPVNGMAPKGGEMFATSWNGDFNYFYQLDQPFNLAGEYASFTGPVTVGDTGRDFALKIDTLASYNGQIYGTAYDHGVDVFFQVNRNANGFGAHIDGLGTLSVNEFGLGDTFQLSAMVGGDNGLEGVAWGNGFNYYFDVDPNASGFGGFVSHTGPLLDGGTGVDVAYKVTALGYLPTPVGVDNGGVPEPATWAMMMLGFGGLGAALRMRRRALAA
jgi:hypothetical protein